MKKIFCLILLLFLMTACGAKQQLDFEQTVSDTLQISGANDFTVADPDFIETNFGAPDYLVKARVYISKANDGRELGFFELADAKHQGDMLARIRDYLESEELSVRSLAALYPADDLQVRLSRFEKATVGAADTLVYYTLP